jgi:hypothetical protein
VRLEGSSSGGGSSPVGICSTLANKLEDGVKDGVAGSRGRASSITAGSTISGSGYGDEDGPFAIEISDRECKLILLDLELKLANGFVNDEGTSRSIELANLSLADV